MIFRVKPWLRKRLLFDLLLASYLLFSYYAFGGWWNSAAGFFLILFFAWTIWKKDFPEHTGLKISLRQAVLSLLSAVAVVILSWLVMKPIARDNNIGLKTGE